jgi:hypothetical protein
MKIFIDESLGIIPGFTVDPLNKALGSEPPVGFNADNWLDWVLVGGEWIIDSKEAATRRGNETVTDTPEENLDTEAE